ncbi:unnamed protein product, partial [Ectocarpus sp. 12 AP-2014]
MMMWQNLLLVMVVCCLMVVVVLLHGAGTLVVVLERRRRQTGILRLPLRLLLRLLLLRGGRGRVCRKEHAASQLLRLQGLQRQRAVAVLVAETVRATALAAGKAFLAVEPRLRAVYHRRRGGAVAVTRYRSRRGRRHYRCLLKLSVHVAAVVPEVLRAVSRLDGGVTPRAPACILFSSSGIIVRQVHRAKLEHELFLFFLFHRRPSVRAAFDPVPLFRNLRRDPRHLPLRAKLAARCGRRCAARFPGLLRLLGACDLVPAKLPRLLH